MNLSYVIYENINGRYKNNLFKKWIIAKLILEAIGSGRSKKTASRLKIPDVERFIDIMTIIMVANLVPPLDIWAGKGYLLDIWNKIRSGKNSLG